MPHKDCECSCEGWRQGRQKRSTIVRPIPDSNGDIPPAPHPVQKGYFFGGFDWQLLSTARTAGKNIARHQEVGAGPVAGDSGIRQP